MSSNLQPENQPVGSPDSAPFVSLSALRHGMTLWGMVGHSEMLRKLQSRIRAAASSDLSVLIVGETGSGKELVAHAIHEESRRRQKRFVAVNTGAIPRELVASELFGHVKGSFTGATNDRDGCFVEANEGTLFLDELTTMDTNTQVGLLRALEQRVVQPVGANREHPVNVRIVAATNCGLADAVKAGTFREDLYYRLEAFEIRVPPLRERKEDIAEIAAFFAEKIARENGREVRGFTPDALKLLTAYHWPGNIRELRNVVSQAVILTQSGIIEQEHLPEKLTDLPVEPLVESTKLSMPNAANGLGGINQAAAKPAANRPPDTGKTITLSLDDDLGTMIEQILERSVDVCEGNVTLAAQLLGISRKTMYNRAREGSVLRDKLRGLSTRTRVLV